MTDRFTPVDSWEEAMEILDCMNISTNKVVVSLYIVPIVGIT
ncbi:MAG: hypothetical protein ACTSSE_03680 [Candidatus Thorarchaeota archaeon]